MCAGSGIGRITFHAKEELRRHQHCPESGLDTVLVRLLFAACGVKRKQGLNIGIRDRATVGTAGESLERLFCADILFLCATWAANSKDDLAAGRIPLLLHVVRAADGQIVETRSVRAFRHVPQLQTRTIDPQIQMRRRSSRSASSANSSTTTTPAIAQYGQVFGNSAGAHEGDTDVANTSLNRNLYFQDLTNRCGGFTETGSRSGHPYLEGIFRVHRECVSKRQAATRAKRKILTDGFTAETAPRGPAQFKQIHLRFQVRVGDRQARNHSTGSEITFQQNRGQGKDIANVVEAIAGVVNRQGVPGPDIQREKVADGVRVFRPVQAVDSRAARVGAGCCGTI